MRGLNTEYAKCVKLSILRSQHNLQSLHLAICLSKRDLLIYISERFVKYICSHTYNSEWTE